MGNNKSNTPVRHRPTLVLALESENRGACTARQKHPNRYDHSILQMTYLLFLIGYAYRLLHFGGDQDYIFSKLSVMDIFLCLWICGQIPNELHQV